MVTNVISGGVHGVEGYTVRVEADIDSGLPIFDIGGNIGSEVREARDRVKTALKNEGYDLPIGRIMVNLSPADRHKVGTLYDLPIAVSLLSAMNVIKQQNTSDTFFAGELMLSGQIRSVKGILPMVIHAKKSGVRRFVIPKDNELEAALIEDIDIYGVSDLKDVISFLGGKGFIEKTSLRKLSEDDFLGYEFDLASVRGQLFAKRGLEIAAAGYHNMLMVGPPGAGKSMLAKCIPSIMPPLTRQECIEISSVYSVGGLLKDKSSIITKRPFISPHHLATEISLIGGGGHPKPGAVSYAGKGVLFMDEFPEFSRQTLEALRQPLEDRRVQLMRNLDTVEYPADFMLVAAMNPCPCGAYPDRKKCNCTKTARERYLGKLSKPLLDRIDICVEVEGLKAVDLINKSENESSYEVRKRVIKAHQIQQERFKDKHIIFNSQMNNKDIDKYCVLGDKQRHTMELLSEKYSLSARSYYRVLKVSRTIADLAGEDEVGEEHLYEAVRLKCSSDIINEI